MIISDERLFEAITLGDAQSCSVALNEGAKVNAARNGRSALLWATARGQIAIVRMLLEHDAKVNTTDLNGWSPLHFAVTQGRLDICQLLLDHGAKPDFGVKTLLLQAAKLGHAAICQLFLAHDVNIRTVDKHGRGPLHVAAVHGNASTCLVLLEYGFDHQSRDKIGQTALDLAMQKGKHECAGTIRAWLAARAMRLITQEIIVSRALRHE